MNNELTLQWQQVLRDSLRTYYQLTKPGIIYGNLFAAIAGFLLAARGQVSLRLLLATLAGTALVVASGCVTNNYIDRHIDARMRRTQNRALVTGAVTPQAALLFAAALGATGLLVLAVYTNLLTVAVGLLGLVSYVVIYSIAKRRSELGALLGSISGATPPLAGYVAVTGRLDVTALLLFICLVLWQMPHFYAIAIFRQSDYQAAGLPVMPIVRGFGVTRRHMIGYGLGFVIAAVALALYGGGWVYGGAIIVASTIWLKILITPHEDSIRWARQVFGQSLIVLSVFCVLLSTSAILP